MFYWFINLNFIYQALLATIFTYLLMWSIKPNSPIVLISVLDINNKINSYKNNIFFSLIHNFNWVYHYKMLLLFI
mgnify:CR=1 FL=1